MKNIFDNTLKNKHIVIVGGGSGMGKATAQLVASLGAKVTIASRNEEKLKAAAKTMEGDITITAVDMTDEAAVKDWASKLDQVDHLVISASSAAHGLFTDLPTTDLLGMFQAKFIGPYVTAREVLPFMNEGASITFFSGVLSRRVSVGATGLGAVNAAVEAITKGLALELAGKARVNCISPGMVDTEAYSAMPEADRAGMFEQVGGGLPVGRVGQANEIAQAVLMTITNEFMTGTVLDVDGGHLIKA